jgi:hypothetical protein
MNRCEQTIIDYLKTHPHERQYLQDKVQMFVTRSAEIPNAVTRIDSELWRYYEERCAVVPAFREALGPGTPRKISMKNLAEYFVRLWTEPRPAKAPVIRQD